MSSVAVMLVKFVAARLFLGIVACGLVLGLLAVRFIPAGAGARERTGRRSPRGSAVLGSPPVH